MSDAWLAAEGSGGRDSADRVPGLAKAGVPATRITAAAAIMVAVFIGFATEGDLVLKQIGAGLAVAILVDATVVRDRLKSIVEDEDLRKYIL